jgi:hypothetical protein
MQYLDAGDKADPTMATNLVKASLKRDLDLAKLRIDYAPRFAKVLPKEKAAASSRSSARSRSSPTPSSRRWSRCFPWYPWPPLEE